MKTKYNKEDLFHSLPDYISEKIDDKDLIREIETEIENNSEFKNEFEDIKKTLSFLSSAELESPAESYFNNLSVRINERIEAGTSTESFWEKLSIAWKILIPAIPIIIIGIILLNVFNNNEKTTITSVNSPEEKIESTEKKNEIKTTDNEPGKVNKQEEKIVDNDSKQLAKNENHPVRKIQKRSNNVEENIALKNPNVDLTEIVNNLNKNVLAEVIETPENTAAEAEEDILYPTENSEDETIEDDFNDLTPEQQQEILKDLENSQI